MKQQNPSSSSSWLSNLVWALILVGALSTTGAIIVTLYTLSHGLGIEANPYFQELGATTFVIASETYILIFYIVAGLSPAKLSLKLLGVLPATIFHFFDFLHDVTGLMHVTVSGSIPIFLSNDPDSIAAFLLAGSVVGVYSFVMLVILAIAFKVEDLKSEEKKNGKLKIA